MTRNQIKLIFFSTVFFFVLQLEQTFSQPLSVQQNYCEFRNDPEGIDVTAPRLSWILSSSQRGDGQTAFQIIVASNISLLSKSKGDLWDSGKIKSCDNNAIYYGVNLKSGKQCYWKVRVWDIQNKVSTWSRPGYWSMGLLSAQDWKGKWITESTIANPDHYPNTPVNCYRSETTPNQWQAKWIVLDLGSEQLIDAINIVPARVKNQNMDFKSVMYPLRYKVEASIIQNFGRPLTLIDHTDQDVDNPRQPDHIDRFSSVKTRYVRIKIVKLDKWDVNLFGLALGGINVYRQNKPIVGDFKVECSDAIESAQWSKRFLLEKNRHIVNAADAMALTVNTKELLDIPSNNKVSRVPTFRREFVLVEPVERATLYITAKGFYECHINGIKIGNQNLVPGCSNFNKRSSYQTFDVTKMVRKGNNAIGAMLGYGWYAGHMNLFENRNIYGHYPLLLAQLEIKLKSGKLITIVTDKEWKATLNGALLWSDLLDGEAVDQRMALKGWDRVGFNDKNWSHSVQNQLDETKLVWQRSQPVASRQELKAIGIKKINEDTYVFDFGQEVAGWCQLNVLGKNGMHIRVRHAEILKENGDIDMSNLWGTTQQDDYILSTNDAQILSPHFTYHGFRYAQVTGLGYQPDLSAVVAVSMQDGVDEVSTFTSSNKLYNRLLHTAVWTQQNLLFDMPNGCAARSERLGWTGDLRPCVQSLVFNMDVSSFLRKYAQDMRDDQLVDGRFTDIAPHAHLENTGIAVGTPGWADVGVSMPWEAYVNYGDKQFLKEHYSSARHWVDFVAAKNPNFIWENDRGMDWGDWLSAGSATPRIIGSTAFFAHSAEQLSKMAGVLNNRSDELKYRTLFNHIREAFIQRFVNKDGIITDSANHADVQGSYGLALSFNILNDGLKEKAADRLARLIEQNDGHLTTGFWSSIEMLSALSDYGHHAAAVQVVNSKSQPSWGYMLEAAGTTFWEFFDANFKNLSLNHWTYSSIGEWLWRYVAGLNPDESGPGYKRFKIIPHPGLDVDSCQARFKSVRGVISISWKKADDIFGMDVTIPPGTYAEIHLPGKKFKDVFESRTPIDQVKGILIVSRRVNDIIIKVPSGTYNFVSLL